MPLKQSKKHFHFSSLLVICPKFDYSAGLQFWPKLVNFYIFGPFWPMSKCAQLSYLIPKNLQNSMQPNDAPPKLSTFRTFSDWPFINLHFLFLCPALQVEGFSAGALFVILQKFTNCPPTSQFLFVCLSFVYQNVG